MAETRDKIVLGILIVMLLGISGVFITAFMSNGFEQQTSNQEVLTNQISLEEAKSIALNSVPGVVAEVGMGKENGVLIYEVEVKDGDFNKEVKISLSGEVLGIETEEDQEVTSSELSKINGIISEMEAKEIALKEVNGRVVEVEAERENGRLFYEVKIEKGNNTYEVKIDAETGKVLEAGQEDEDD